MPKDLSSREGEVGTMNAACKYDIVSSSGASARHVKRYAPKFLAPLSVAYEDTVDFKLKRTLI